MGVGLDTYRANVVVGTEMAGAPLLHVDALVVVGAGFVSGHAEITQAVPPPNGDIQINNMTGRIREMTLGSQKLRVVTLAGTYTRSFPPPAIGEILEHFEATLLLEAEGPWIGVGCYSYANNSVDDVPVRPAIHMDDLAAADGASAAPAAGDAPAGAGTPA